MQVDFPGTGFYLGATGNYLSIDGDSVSDLIANVGYKFTIIPTVQLALEAGYRVHEFEVEDVGDFDADFESRGSYVGVNLHIGI